MWSSLEHGQAAVIAITGLYGLGRRMKYLVYLSMAYMVIPLRDHSGGRPKCSHPLKSIEELTGVILLGSDGFSPSRWLILLIKYLRTEKKPLFMINYFSMEDGRYPSMSQSRDSAYSS
ncbi:hypothetical protein BDB01DRAFT_832333 [Pilobolus umbonatus]|nr:hypothetical protein BDB01DRAFT_832333 [Pilobolus umbonatus]